MPDLASELSCSGCLACLDKCPENAIFVTYGNDGHRYVRINPDKCIGCKLCERTCPIVNDTSYGSNTFGSEFLAGWSKEDGLRTHGATSGIFGSIAKSFIATGGWVAGAIMDGLQCKYSVTDSICDLDRLQGSKYTSSNPSGIYASIHDILKGGGKVLFSGLPCHVAALLSYIPAILHKSLYTIDLICGGVSSPILIEKFAQKNPEIESIVSFRNKIHGWKPTGYKYSLTYKTKEGKIISQSTEQRNLITDGFACELTDRHSCYDCKFTGIKRKSDLTIGDLWKDTLFPEQHFKGVSAIIVHSKKGKELLESSSVQCAQIEPLRVLRPNSRIYNGKSIKGYFPERKMSGWLFKHLSYESLLRIYASDLRTKNPLWWPMAAYRVISFRIAHLIQKRTSQNILSKLLK